MSYGPKRYSVFAAMLCSLSFQKNQSNPSVHADDIVNVMLYTEEYEPDANQIICQVSWIIVCTWVETRQLYVQISQMRVSRYRV